MTRSAHLVYALYGAASVFLIYATVQQALYGEPWAVLALSLCSLVPIIAFVREAGHADDMAIARTNTERAVRLRDRKEQRGLREAANALGHVCCERCWTSLGTDHDETCETQRRTA